MQELTKKKKNQEDKKFTYIIQLANSNNCYYWVQEIKKMENFNRIVKIIKLGQVEILKLKNITTEFKNLVFGLNSRLGTI